MLLDFKEGASYRLRTAVRTGQPPPFVQHLHQTHDCHLTLSPADHVQETLQGQKQAHSLPRYRTHEDNSVSPQLRSFAINGNLIEERKFFFLEKCSICVIVLMFPNAGRV